MPDPAENPIDVQPQEGAPNPPSLTAIVGWALVALFVVMVLWGPKVADPSATEPLPEPASDSGSPSTTASEPEPERTSTPAAEPTPEAAPRAPEDYAGQAAEQAWQDLRRGAHLGAMYSQMFWESATNEERLLVACKYGELDLVTLLTERGADVNAQDHGANGRDPVLFEGATPLMMAARSGKLEIVKYLLDQGADANVHDPTGETELHFAVRSGSEDVALLLLEHGADPNARSVRTNETAYSLAFGMGLERVRAAMEARGGHF